MYKFKKQHLQNNNRPGVEMEKVKGIVLHDVGSQPHEKDSTAQNNADYFYNNPGLKASVHYFVDKETVIEIIPPIEKAWHVASNNTNILGGKANDVAIGVELCHHQDFENQKKAYDNWIMFIADLAIRFHINVRTKIPHHRDLQKYNRKDMVGNEGNRLGKSYGDIDDDLERATRGDYRGFYWSSEEKPKNKEVMHQLNMEKLLLHVSKKSNIYYGKYLNDSETQGMIDWIDGNL